jgi:deoxyribose-phosphate aldolase
VVLKVILESALWSPVVLRTACEAVVDAGADFVKTSTGFHPAGGATVDAVTTMRAAVGTRARVKASGGIRTAGDALAMLDAGAERLGLSATAAVVAGVPA